MSAQGDSDVVARLVRDKRHRLKDPEAQLYVCAPMVRYSKLAFRRLSLKWGCDLVYTPMILSDAFSASERARHSEFTTLTGEDYPMIVQFAANKVEDFVSSAQLVQDHCQGVDLNCGCPQRWAWKEGIGACLIHRPEFLQDLVRQSRNRCRPGLSVSCKIRVHEDGKESVELCRNLQAAGVDFITVHGRTVKQRGEPVNLPLVSDIKKSLDIPLFANGDVRSLEDAKMVRDATNCDGVMAARGMLENPAMFMGCEETPSECVRDWVRLALETGTPFVCFHHHLIYMCERSLPKTERRIFNALTSTAAVLDFLDSYDIRL